MSKICTKCGNILSDGTMYCARCGKPVAQVMNNQQNNQRNQNMNQQWNNQNRQAVNNNNQWNNPNGQGMNNQWNNPNGQGMNNQWNNPNGQGMNNQWNNPNGQGMNNQWNNQGGRQQAIRASIQNHKNNIILQSRNLLSGGNKKFVLIGIGVLALLIVLMAIFITGRKPSNSKLKEQFPNNLLTYEYEDEVRTSKLKSLKVERRMSGKDYDTAYCKVELEDEIMTRILYVEMNSQKFSQGGWNVTYCYIYQTDEIIPKSTPEDYINKKLSEINTADSALTNVQETKNDDGSYTYTMDVMDKKASGTFSMTIKMVNLSEEREDSLNEVEFPMEYGWSTTHFDTSNIKTE